MTGVRNNIMKSNNIPEKDIKALKAVLIIFFISFNLLLFLIDKTKLQDYGTIQLNNFVLIIPKSYCNSESVYSSGSTYVSLTPQVRIFAFDLDNMTETEMEENDYIDYSLTEQLYLSKDYEEAEVALEEISDVYGNLDILSYTDRRSFQNYVYWGYNNGFWLVFFFNYENQHFLCAINDSSRKTSFDREVGRFILSHSGRTKIQ